VFSVLAIGTRADVDRVASRCLSVIEQPLATESGLVDLTAAVGLVPLTAGLTEREALDRADLALRDARAAAPGTVRRYSDDLGAARDRQEQLRRDLLGARERGELTLAWQPGCSARPRSPRPGSPPTRDRRSSWASTSRCST
jgi:predicted signal transduction protein with EAL and GGDEF domain